jgi:hypothetical protein
MPSVPQSLLWISLVVLWLFVLVPMLISKRDAVRRTSDVALATRVLNSGTARKLKRGAPAAGHRSDPHWQPAEDLDDDLDADDEPAPRPVVVSGLKDANADDEPDYLDVDVVEEDSGALPLGSGAVSEEPAEINAADEPEAEMEAEPEPERVVTAVDDVEDEYEADDEEDQPAADEEDATSDEYEYVEDTSGLESGDEPATAVSPGASRRRQHDSKTAAAVSARKFKFRKRVLTLMALVLIVTTTAALTVWPSDWWLCGMAGVVTVLYLIYLRRQTRIEERLRRRRTQRMARSRVGVENTADRGFDVVPSRLRRPGSVVLEIDDEDPIFEHLDYAPGPVEYHLPRAAGQ